MTPAAAPAMQTPVHMPTPFFHFDSGALRFWVLTPDRQAMGASVTSTVLHYRFRGLRDGSDALTIYAAHRRELEAAVLRRVATGSREPVMLREFDLAMPPPGAAPPHGTTP